MKPPEGATASQSPEELVAEFRGIAHRAVTEGVNIKYIDILRKACYEACDLAESLQARLTACEQEREKYPQHRLAAYRREVADLEARVKELEAAVALARDILADGSR